MSNDVNRLAEDLRSFFRRHTSEVPHLNQSSQGLVFTTERVKSGIQIQELYLIDTGDCPYFDGRRPLTRVKSAPASPARFFVQRARA